MDCYLKRLNQFGTINSDHWELGGKDNMSFIFNEIMDCNARRLNGNDTQTNIDNISIKTLNIHLL